LEEGDIRDMEFLKKIFKQYPIKTVVHLAAMAGVRPSLKNPRLYEEVNIQGTLNLLECMKDFGIKNYVFASSSSVYGEKKEGPFHEEMKVDRPISFYASTKKAGEELNHVYHYLHGIKTVNLRFFTVYGPRQRPDLAIHKFARLIQERETLPIYGDGSFRRDFTYIEDIIDGVVKSIELVEKSDANMYEIFNLGESQTVTVNQMIDILEESLGIPAKRDYQEQQPGDVPLTYADISRAKKILGYSPKTLITEGIPKFVTWFLEKREKSI
jgi:UDP-glucuronate 4-epimerase